MGLTIEDQKQVNALKTENQGSHHGTPAQAAVGRQIADSASVKKALVAVKNAQNALASSKSPQKYVAPLKAALAHLHKVELAEAKNLAKTSKDSSNRSTATAVAAHLSKNPDALTTVNGSYANVQTVTNNQQMRTSLAQALEANLGRTAANAANLRSQVQGTALGAVPLDRRLPSPDHRKVALGRN